MMIELTVEGNRTMLNMDNVIAVTENEDKIDIYATTGIITADFSYSNFTKFLEKNKNG